MELGATMELMGEEVGQLWGRRPPYIVGGTIQPLPPKTAPQRAVLPQEAAVLPLGPAVLPLPLAVLPCSLGGLACEQETDPVRYCRGGRAVLPLSSGQRGVTVGLFPPRYKGVFFPKVDSPLPPKAPLLLQAPFSPDLSP